MRPLLLLVLFIAIAGNAIGQSNKEQAYKLGELGVALIDQGKIDEGIAKLEEAEKLDPENIDYPYEIGYALYYKKEYKEAAKKLRPLTKHKDVTASVFQLLGNCYDMMGNPTTAVEIYDDGLKKFPNAGNLFLEKGVMKLGTKEYDDALAFFEEGIEKDPEYPSNYYWAAKLFLSSTEEVWGMIYGELFMNMERNSRRTQEISKLLFDTYQSEITFSGDTSISYSFSQFNLLDPSKGFHLPYGVGVYEMTLGVALAGVPNTEMESLNLLRNNFVDAYYQLGHDKNYPNILFSYQKEMKDNGMLDAYNYWILMYGNVSAFESWKKGNMEAYDQFVQWFIAHPIEIDAKHHFYRAQYD